MCNRTDSEIPLKIYVGNLSFQTNEASLRNTFAAHGAVEEVAVITDRDTGQPRGFAFVTMPDSAARAAISALDGKELDGRALKVNEAKAKSPGGGGGAPRRGGW
jgi:RNA recognition motif-containing protein